MPSDCKPGETWVTDHPKSTGNWTAFCRILPSGSSNSKAYKFWASKIQHSRPDNWPFPEEKTTDWRPKEVKDVLLVLDNTPIELWNSSLNGIYRMHRSKDFPNPGINWENNIVLYDTAFQDEQYLSRVLTHELAHRKFRSFSEKQRIDYAQSLGWKITKTKKGDQVFEAPGCSFVEPDGRYSIDEDFSNSIENYLLDPASLKKKNPKAFQWIKNYFNPNFKSGDSK